MLSLSPVNDPVHHDSFQDDLGKRKGGEGPDWPSPSRGSRRRRFGVGFLGLLGLDRAVIVDEALGDLEALQLLLGGLDRLDHVVAVDGTELVALLPPLGLGLLDVQRVSHARRVVALAEVAGLAQVLADARVEVGGGEGAFLDVDRDDGANLHVLLGAEVLVLGADEQVGGLDGLAADAELLPLLCLGEFHDDLLYEEPL